MKGNAKHLFSISSGDKVISERYNITLWMIYIVISQTSPR